jgi:hypothetical protein
MATFGQQAFFPAESKKCSKKKNAGIMTNGNNSHLKVGKRWNNVINKIQNTV